MSDKQPQHRDVERLGANERAAAVVLRDVVMHGQVALTRPGQRHAGSEHMQGAEFTPNLAPVPFGRKGEAGGAQPDPELPKTPSAAALAEEEARRVGYEDGFARGHAQGGERAAQEARQAAAQAQHNAERELEERAQRLTKELQQQFQTVQQARLGTLESLIGSLPSQIEARLAAVEDDMLALSFEAICRVLGDRAVQPDAVRAQIVQAMEGLRDRRLVAVHLHPDDLTSLQDATDASTSNLWRGDDVKWIASAQVVLGGCILQSPEGGLDARLETQLHALRDLLKQSRAASRLRDA